MSEQYYGESLLLSLGGAIGLAYCISTLYYALRYSSQLDFALLAIPMAIMVGAILIVLSIRLYRYVRAKRLKKAEPPDSLYMGKKYYGDTFLSLLAGPIDLLYFVAAAYYASRYSSYRDYVLLMLPGIIYAGVIVVMISIRPHWYVRAKRLKKAEQDSL